MKGRLSYKVAIVQYACKILRALQHRVDAGWIVVTSRISELTCFPSVDGDRHGAARGRIDVEVISSSFFFDDVTAQRKAFLNQFSKPPLWFQKRLARDDAPTDIETKEQQQ